jgi:hypothetical protein
MTSEGLKLDQGAPGPDSVVLQREPKDLLTLRELRPETDLSPQTKINLSFSRSNAGKNGRGKEKYATLGSLCKSIQQEVRNQVRGRTRKRLTKKQYAYQVRLLEMEPKASTPFVIYCWCGESLSHRRMHGSAVWIFDSQKNKRY